MTKSKRAENMELRDYFAGQALIALSNRPYLSFSVSDASEAYIIADEMMKVREKKEKKIKDNFD